MFLAPHTNGINTRARAHLPPALSLLLPSPPGAVTVSSEAFLSETLVSAAGEAGGSRAAPPPPGDAGLSRGDAGMLEALLLLQPLLLLLPVLSSSSLGGAAAGAVLYTEYHLAASGSCFALAQKGWQEHPRRTTLR